MDEQLHNLFRVCQDAITYVGQANYREREGWASMEVSRAFKQYGKGETVTAFTEDNRD